MACGWGKVENLVEEARTLVLDGWDDIDYICGVTKNSRILSV